MSKLLKLYSKSIYSKLGNKKNKDQINLINKILPPQDIIIPNQTGLLNSTIPIHNIDYNQQSLLNRYIEFEPIQFQGENSLLDVYYKTYGYTALASTVGGYLLGTFDATTVLQSGLSLLIPGASRGGINSFLLNTANTALRNPLVENTINNFLPSPFQFTPDSQIKWQTLPSEFFYITNPPKSILAGNGTDTVLQIGGSALMSLFNSTISGLASGGTLTSFDWERAFGKGLDTAEVILLAQAGIKYTRAVAWFDPQKPQWSDQPGFYTYDKYIAYSGGVLTYSTAMEVYGDTMLDRYGNIGQLNIAIPRHLPGDLTIPVNPVLPATPGTPSLFSGPEISKNINKSTATNAQSYQQALGQIPSADEDPSIKYSNGPEIRNKINRLGFPQFNISESKEIGSNEYIDKINMLDVGDDYPNDIKDIILFKFEDISTKVNDPIPIIFRASITNLSDKFSPSWNDIQYLGRADTFYTYNGITRGVSFNMMVYNNSIKETSTQWRKINRLVGLCYPVNYTGNRAMKAPIIRLSIGNLYRRIYGFFDSIDISISDDVLWDTQMNNQFPQYVNLSISFTVLYLGDGSGAPRSNSSHFNQGGLLYDGAPITISEPES